MNPIEAIEAALVERLRVRLPGSVSSVDAFPDALTDYDFPGTQAAAAFVRYAGSDFAPTGDDPRATYTPRENQKFQVVLLVRNLRSAQGGRVSAYDLLSEIRRGVHGHSFVGSTPMVPRRTWLDGEGGGVWRWVIEFACGAPAVSEPPQRFDTTGAPRT